MPDPFIVGRLDVAEIVFFAFVLFFIGLVFYLRREDRREGYPLEDAVTGRIDSAFGPLTASTVKRFALPFGRGTAETPTQGREPVQIAARRVANFGGAPYAPTGNPLTDGVGPAAFAERARWPDVDMEGHARIVPIGVAGFTIAKGDPDPRGMTVVGVDGRAAGTVSDIWVDRSEKLVRYIDVALGGGGRAVVPFNMAVVKRDRIVVDALPADKFAGAPVPAEAGTITRYEEERAMAYFGGGYLYGTPERTEPLI
jgi:photosynthetic reaction center H subunit